MSKDLTPSAKSAAPAGAGESDKIFDPEISRQRYKTWFPDLSEPVLASLLEYQSELVKFNKTVNLVSSGTLKVADAVHFADAVYAYTIIKPQLKRDAPLYDFGSGNGIPGLVFAILDPEMKVILIDRDERKLEFCKHVASTLKLRNLSTLIQDVDQLPERSIYNVCSRGFAPLPKAMLLARKSVAKGGKFFHLKGDGWANELASVPSQLFSFWSPALLGQYRLPDLGGEMAVVVTEKTAE